MISPGIFVIFILLHLLKESPLPPNQHSTNDNTTHSSLVYNSPLELSRKWLAGLPGKPGALWRAAVLGKLSQTSVLAGPGSKLRGKQNLLMCVFGNVWSISAKSTDTAKMQIYNVCSCVEKSAGNPGDLETHQDILCARSLCSFLWFARQKFHTGSPLCPMPPPYRLGMSSHPFQLNKLH